jgi:Na+/melibiose symporter-like transporter
LVVERARRESLTQSGSLQSLTWGISALGGLITAYLGGWLLAHLGTRPVFALTAIFPLIASAMAFLITEEKVKNNDNTQSTPKVKEQIGQLWSAIRQKSILLPTAFIFLWQATPSADSAFFYFTTNELGFEPEFLGRVRLVTSLASYPRDLGISTVFKSDFLSFNFGLEYGDFCAFRDDYPTLSYPY